MTEKATTAVARTQQTAPAAPKYTQQGFNQFLGLPKVQRHIHDMLGERSSQFVTTLASIVNNNKLLQSVEPTSLMYCCVKAASMNLSVDPNLGHSYVIPYKNNKTGITEAQFQMGYKGFIQLALRSGEFVNINTTEIREGEIGKRNIVTGELEINDIADRMERKVVGYAAYFRLKNGFSKMLYMTVAEMEAHATRYSQSYKLDKQYHKKASLWSTDFDAMARKTVLKQLLSKFAPLSLDMQTATSLDQQAFTSENETHFVDNEQDMTSGVAGIAAQAVADDDVVIVEETPQDEQKQPENESKEQQQTAGPAEKEKPVNSKEKGDISKKETTTTDKQDVKPTPQGDALF